jgi:hypothetical protein
MDYPNTEEGLREQTTVGELLESSFNHQTNENHAVIEGILAQVETGSWAILEEGLESDPRAACATECFDLTLLIREAVHEGDANAACRYSLTLLLRQQELLNHGGNHAAIEVQNWRKGVERSVQARRRKRDLNRRECFQEAIHYWSENPRASDRATAKHVAEMCEAKFETVRKALPTLRRRLEMSGRKES